MEFNSIEYFLFFICIFFIFWFPLRVNLKLQNIFLIIGSYFFYAWWDWRFLSLIIIESLANYYAGIQIGSIDSGSTEQRRKFFLFFSMVVNLSILFFFKYFNFFTESTIILLNSLGFKADALALKIILPIGISFYTFQTLSYTFDVYKTRIEPSKDIISFLAYSSFFPLLLAGPIERAENLLPQFNKRKVFNYDEGVNGMRLILWGLFKKTVIADNCAILVNNIFENYESQSASVLIMGSIYFAFQIYGDFSGYSDMAIGSAKLLGFNLTSNFKTPYFSRNIAEFWRRWHISLSSWLRDYLFIPLNLKLRNLKVWGTIVSIIITFLICGFWHGANLTYIAWGGLIGLYFIPSLLPGKNIKIPNTVAEGKYISTLKEVIQMGTTFALICIGWIFFRAESLSKALNYFKAIFSNSFLPSDLKYFPHYLIFLITIFLFCEWFLFRHENYLEHFGNTNRFIRKFIYATTTIIIFLFIQNKASAFIYFQF